MTINAIVLAAGKGTRMKSDTVKIAHQLAGKPIVHHVLDTLLALSFNQIYLVVGHQIDRIKELTSYARPSFIEQKEQNGTGHAVQQASPFFEGKENSTVLVCAGDCPLVTEETIANVLKTHHDSKASATILTAELSDPGSYGRILRDDQGKVIGIREAKDCNDVQRAVKEINSGAYCFESQALFEALAELRPDNAQGELYLTDVIEIMKQKGLIVDAYCTHNEWEIMGINSRQDLAAMHQIVYRQVAKKWMDEGVTIIDPDTTYIEPTVTIGADTVIHPCTTIKGTTSIGQNCEIGPHSSIVDAVVENGTHVTAYSQVH